MGGHELLWCDISHIKVIYDEEQDRDGNQAAPHRKGTCVFHGLDQVSVQQIICAGNNKGEEEKLVRKTCAGYGGRICRDIP